MQTQRAGVSKQSLPVLNYIVINSLDAHKLSVKAIFIVYKRLLSSSKKIQFSKSASCTMALCLAIQHFSDNENCI